MEISQKTLQMKGSRLKAVVYFDHIRYPKRGHQPGDFAIAQFHVKNIIAGELPAECLNGNFYAKGPMPSLNDKNDYVFTGTLRIDPQWGPQYEVEQIRLNYDMKRPDDQKRFFEAFLTKRQIERLYSSVDNPIVLLENRDIDALTKIKDIGEYTAEHMCDKFDEARDYSRAYVELGGLGLTTHAIQRLCEKYRSVDVVVDKVKENPYILIEEVRGYGWEKCDQLALRQGLRPDSRERVLAYMRFLLMEEGRQNGNSWISINGLIESVYDKCRPIDGKHLSNYLKSVMGGDPALRGAVNGSLPKERWPLLFIDPKNKRVGLFIVRLMEYQIAQNLRRIRNAQQRFTYDHDVCERMISEAEEEQGFNYTTEQRDAIYKMLSSNIFIISGNAGTGKTSMLNAVVRIFNYYKESIAQCALSGRASSKMSEVTNVEGQTIHRLLSYTPMGDDDGDDSPFNESRFRYNERNQLPYDVVILDEASMVGGEIFLSLVKAIADGTKFIMVGDFHQLEAIGLANVLKDCMSTGGYLPTAVLTKIHRQAARSGIITQAALASSGTKLVSPGFEGKEIRGELKDFELICSEDTAFTQPNILSEYRHLLFDEHIPANQIQVIVPQRTRGAISCYILNNRLQDIANPTSSLTDVKTQVVDNGSTFTVTYKVGDRVIITKNCYQARTPSGGKTAIYNGNVGYVKSINNSSMIVNLTQQGDVVVPREKWSDISLAYAITCHKKQGDQIPYAIIGLDYSNYAMLSREWLYTAITRASKYCILVGQPKAINTAVGISRVKIKQTWLKEDLLAFAKEDGYLPSQASSEDSN